MQTLCRAYSGIVCSKYFRQWKLAPNTWYQPFAFLEWGQRWMIRYGKWFWKEINLKSILGYICSCWNLLFLFSSFFLLYFLFSFFFCLFVLFFFFPSFSFLVAPYAIFLFPASWQQGAALLSPSQSCLQMWEAIRFCSTTGRVD